MTASASTPSSPSLRAATPHKAFSIERVSAIASNTLLELVRLKVFYFLLLFALGLIGSSIFMVNLSFQDQFQVLKDISLGAMSIFTWLLGLLSTAMLLPKDTEDRTLYTILAKPVPRFEYLLGKLLGVFVMLAIALLLMTGGFLIVLYLHEQKALAELPRMTAPDQLEAAQAAVRASAFNINLLPGILTIYLKSALCASFTLLVSTFSSSWIFTVIVSMMVYFIGHVEGIAREAWLHQASAQNGLPVITSAFLSLVAIFFPDLQVFSLVDDVVVGTAIPFMLFMKAAVLGIGYSAVYLLVAYLLFAWKEL